MKSAENIEKLFKNLDLDIDTNAEADQKILKELIETHKKSKQINSALVEPNIRMNIMKNPITKLAVAAVIIVVVTLGLVEFIDTGSSSGVVWAEVIQNVQDSRGVIYRTRTIGMGDPNNDWPKAHIMHHKSPLHSRTDWYKEGQIQRTVNFDLSTKTQVWLAHDAKAYDRKTMTEERIQSVLNSQKSGWLRPEDITSKILDFEHWNIGTKTIDGILCEGLETNDPAVCGAPPTKTFVGRLWVSVGTRYPVRIEVEATDGEDGSVQMKGFVDQFEWDVEFSPGDRQINIPPGFRSLSLEGEMKILSEQGKKELLKVEETIVVGTGRMRVHVYRYKLSDGQIKDNREAAAYEVDDMTHRKKFGAQLDEFRQLRKAGLGEDLDKYEETVEGRVFSFKREKYLLSDGTEVTWSIGTPK